MTTTELSIPGASCLMWTDGPQWEGRAAGTIGRLAIEYPEAGRKLVTMACEQLAQAGCAGVLAPMEGDTWHPYRVVLESDGSPPFLLEPTSGAHDHSTLKACGFDVLEEYVSARAAVPVAGSAEPAVPGIAISAWDGRGAAQLVGQLHAYAAGSFADKLFFKPLDEAGFRAMYEPLIAMLDPRLVLFAHDAHGNLVGFLFGLPDLAQGERPTQAILKTYASTVRGVGRQLAWQFHERARDMGFTHVVHALMHSANRSRGSSGLFGGTEFRRYGILGKRLGG